MYGRAGALIVSCRREYVCVTRHLSQECRCDNKKCACDITSANASRFFTCHKQAILSKQSCYIPHDASISIVYPPPPAPLC